MTWATPAAVTTGQLMTSAFWNQQVRDNMLESSAATVTTAGDLAYADAANSMGSRLAIGAVPAILASTGSAPVWRTIAGLGGDTTYTAVSTWPTSFTDFNSALWGSGTNVTVTVTTGTDALVMFGARSVAHPTAGSTVAISYRISGATTVAASALYIVNESGAANDATSMGRVNLETVLTAGSNTFTLQGSVSTGAAGTVARPYIIVQGL